MLRSSVDLPPWVSALGWCLLTPPLVSLPRRLVPRGEHWSPAFIQRQLAMLADDSRPLEECVKAHPGCRPPRLGIRFEQLVGFYLSRLPAVESLVSNLQVPATAGTLGEFDLLYRLQGEDHYRHLEMAVKFYLRPFPGHQRMDWVGLDPRDRLDLKLRRMLGHQLRLGEHAESKALLQSKGIHIAEREALLTGCLYYPWTEFQSAAAVPTGAHPAHLQGWWLHEEEVSRLADPKVRVVLQHGDLRLTPRLAHSRQVLDFAALQRHLAMLREQGRFRRPLMLACWESHQPGLTCRFYQRGLVVPEYWLAQLRDLRAAGALRPPG